MPRSSRPRRIVAAALAGAAALFGSSVALARPAPAKQPNVVVILADDLGWPDVSSYGRSEAPTLNLDRIARAGVAFSDGYVAASVCAVSRAGLLTGRRPASFGFAYNISDEGDDGAGLPTSVPTLAERLRPLGYRSGAFGKWHQGAEPRFYPTNRGFDAFFGFVGGETVYVDPRTPGIVTRPTKADKYAIDARKPGGRTVEGPNATPAGRFDRYLTDEITDHAVDFIDRSAGKPFFAYVAYNAPHWPLQAPQRYYDRFAGIKDPVRRTYLAMIAAMDAGVGRVLDALERGGVRDDTIVVFLSDNGCPVQFGFCQPTHPWGAGKFTYLEGGIRVPFLFSWPARLRPQGVSAVPVTALDIVPTVLRAAAPGGRVPSGLDGDDLLALLAAPNAPPRTLLWGQEPVYAARRGPLKLWQSRDWGQTHLYALPDDPRERTDVSAARAADRARLEATLARWRATLPEPLWPLHMTRHVEIDGRDTEWVY